MTFTEKIREMAQGYMSLASSRDPTGIRNYTADYEAGALAGFALAVEMLESEEAVEVDIRANSNTGMHPRPADWADWLEREMQ